MAAASGNRRLPVDWEVASDEGFAQIVRRGRLGALPARAHSVHVDVRGLEPASWYFSAFASGAKQHSSPRRRRGCSGVGRHGCSLARNEERDAVSRRAAAWAVRQALFQAG